MVLKGRLAMVAEKVSDCNTIADIGTDHGYIPIWLILNGRCKRAIAADIRSGPLQAAKRNIEVNRLGALIETRMGSGLSILQPDEADTVVVAGMGGLLIRDILAEGINKLPGVTLVLQPMNAQEELREWLYRDGFDIEDEELVQEGHKLYTVLTVKWTGIRQEPDMQACWVGRKLLERNDPLLGKYIRRMQRILLGINQEIKAHGFPDNIIYGRNEMILRLLQETLGSLKAD